MKSGALALRPMPEVIKYINEDVVAEMLGVSVRTVQRWRVTGDGPKFCRAGARLCIYNPADVHAWVASRTFNHRADELTREVA